MYRAVEVNYRPFFREEMSILLFDKLIPEDK
jgi:hypothetical protein